MGRDSILDDAERTRQQNEDESEPADESPGDGDAENGEEERVRLTQRMTPDLAAKVDAVQDRYQLPSRNATINFILIEGIDSLLEEDDR
jgi:hypothetical protein